MLTKAEILFLLDLLREKYGMGYADHNEENLAGLVQVDKMQAKLSIMLEVADITGGR